MLSNLQRLCRDENFEQLVSLANASRPNEQYCIFKMLCSTSKFHALRAAAAILRSEKSGRMAKKRAREFVDDKQNWGLVEFETVARKRVIESDSESEEEETNWTVENLVHCAVSDRESAAQNIFDDNVAFNRNLIVLKRNPDKKAVFEHDKFSYDKFPFVQFLDFVHIPLVGQLSENTFRGDNWISSPFIRGLASTKRAMWRDCLFLEKNIAGRIRKSADFSLRTRQALSKARKKSVRDINTQDDSYLQNQMYGKRSCLQLRLRVMTKFFNSCRVPIETLVQINGHSVKLREEDGYSYENMFGYDVSEYAKEGSNDICIVLNGDNCSANTRFVLNIVEWFDCNQIIAQLPRWDFEQSKRHVERIFNIEETLHQHPISMIETSIEDVFSMTPILVPIRFVDCAHLRCFEAANFLHFFSLQIDMMQCPVCNRADKFQNLVLDEGFMQCIADTRKHNCTKFRVYKNDLHISCFS